MNKKGYMYREDRERGMTYREIAEKYGITPQSAHTSCMKAGGRSVRVITEKACIWPNLRRWLNADRERQNRFFQAMEGCTIRDCMKGIRQPKKDVIDRMIRITGMRYEELFAEE